MKAALVWALLGGVTASFAAPALKDHPPPGLYEIDTRMTQTSRAGPMVLTTVTETDGRTGDQTVTVTRTPDDMPPQVTRTKGSGPVRHCVGNADPALTGNCKSVVKGNAAIATTCSGISQNMSWRRLDAGQWEWRDEVAMAVAPGAGAWNVPAGFGVLPADAARAQAMAKAQGAAASVEIAALLEQARLEAASSDPERAAEGRAALAALEGVSSVGGAPSVISVQRYRRIDDRCTVATR
ncbi:MAG: hypothetical protein O9327_10575 [Polaromonas sp.]|nr:hypothetical protein [Polaromonas sp.]